MKPVRFFPAALLAATFAAPAALGSEPPKPAPKITPEQRAKFWRAQAEYLAASIQAQKFKAVLEAAQMELAKACGDQQVAPGPDSEPGCAPKPKASGKSKPDR